ncbi:OmpA family protein [Tahibacter amnicola]|uniref:OmpA family protein n=1 Tax=Tahibacter amnicola TaxID=2976241 RepID=A0ABY6BIU8_9GAMM|nr:OmpA family protein [Tahibacter amnicola]UXI69934.1 OmpA family protein [Tahibacter amnicola]
MDRRPIAFAVMSAVMLAGCATTPDGPAPQVVRLQSELDRLRHDQRIAVHADAELDNAEAAIVVLARDGRRLDHELFDHGVYLADRLLRTAEAEGLARFAEVRAQELGTERERLLADARARQIDIAQLRAKTALKEAAAAEQQAQNERIAAAQARLDAQAARAERDVLQEKLADLEARPTQRGLVVTLGDVLFETGRAELKPGATRNLDQLANALKSDDAATVSIEGHTDTVGARDFNIALSRDRAESVKSYLANRGVDMARLSARGMGPDYPIADNTSASGRQQNRRVEVVVQNPVAR